MAETPSLPEVIEAAAGRRLRGVHTAAPGEFVSYSDGLATVRLTVKVDGQEVSPIAKVPVAFDGAWEAGDPCLLVFSEEQFGADLTGTGNLRRHGFYAIAVPLEFRPGQSSDFVALASLVEANFVTLAEAIQGAAVLAGDGGATFKANILAALASANWPSSVAALKLRARLP